LSAIDPGSPADGTPPLSPISIDTESVAASARPLLDRAQSLVGLRTLAFVLVIVATSLYLLERLEPVLRPLLIAVLLTYLFLPVYTRLRRHMRPVFSFLIIAIGITLGLQFLARLVYRDVVLIDQNLPRYLERQAELEDRFRELSKPFLPWLDKSRAANPAANPGDILTSELSQRIVRGAATAFLSVFLELFVVAFYMIFLLQSASRLPERIQSSFSSARAKAILEITRSINRSISEYLVVKVKASLLVGIPVALACWAFGITGAVTWGMITFFGNFLPYIGALVAIIPPVALAFLEYHTLWPPLLFVMVLLLIHGTTSNLIEPAMTGKALGLSPLVVLIGLAFWSLLWGFVGMILAVPLTVIFKIVLEHTPATRPIARMISEDA
jgi:AI-2 transport protein TqsA